MADEPRVPESIACPDCDGRARLLSRPAPDDPPWAPGDVASYRCPECGERFDVVVDEEAEDRSED